MKFHGTTKVADDNNWEHVRITCIMWGGWNGFNLLRDLIKSIRHYTVMRLYVHYTYIYKHLYTFVITDIILQYIFLLECIYYENGDNIKSIE